MTSDKVFKLRWFGGVLVAERAWLLTEAGSGENTIQSLQCSCTCLVRHDPEPCPTVWAR